MTLVHGTCVALDDVGVLLRGPSGSGKSDMALRLIDGGALLVADDQTRLDLVDGRLISRPPETIAGRLEVRGLGIVPVAWVASAPLGLVVDLVAQDAVDRLPPPAEVRILGAAVPLLRLWPFAASAAAQVRLAVRAHAGGIIVPP
jgi:serine kinase of HPr protein (carbohydrate metabolism regulator)